MHQPLVLLLTDIVDSTRIFSALGEVAAAHLWAQHDERARDLLLTCAAREVERGDGFLLLFDDMADAARFAQGYHALLQALDTPLTARIGIHLGPIRVRENAPDHVGRGARALDLSAWLARLVGNSRRPDPSMPHGRGADAVAGAGDPCGFE